MKFRKKPVVVDAVQWRKGEKPLPCMVPYGESVIEQFPQYEGFYFIETLEGNHHVSDGDYVITGVNGESYPCKPDIFAATYEPVDDTANPSHQGTWKHSPNLPDAPCAAYPGWRCWHS